MNNNLSEQANNINSIIINFGPVRPVDIATKANISNKNLYKHLRNLLNEGLISKTGNTPEVYYQKSENITTVRGVFDKSDQCIENNYIYVSANGEIIRGILGFETWCAKNNFNFENEKLAYVKNITAINKLKHDQLISAKKIILSGNNKLYLDNIYFSDFYTFAHFGKTKLGQLVYVAKSSQNKDLIAEVVKNIRPVLEKLIEKYQIGLICFIPPTIQRKIQFMEVFKKQLRFTLPVVAVNKVKTPTIIAQKSLRKLADRIQNAQKSISINPNQKINHNILIIDDATGSGATLNETAKKIRNIATKDIKIIGYSIIGSYKDFDVISEV